MKYLLLMPLIFLKSCAGFQGVADDLEKIADDNAVKIEVSREAIQRDTNLEVNVNVTNKEPLPVNN